MPKIPKILVVDDYPLSREGTAIALRELPCRPQVQEAGTLEQTFERLAEGGFHIVLLDLVLQHTTGIDTLQRVWNWLDERGMDTRILALSGLRDPRLVHQALAHYATGFISKTAPRDVLQQAVMQTLAGGVYVPQQLLELASTQGVAAPRLDAATVKARLTASERAVAAQLIKGLTYKRIARELQARSGRPLSEHTVRAHVGNIAWKLGVEENAKAGVMACIARLGLMFDDPSDRD